MAKKGEDVNVSSNDNSYGVVSVVMGILALVLGVTSNQIAGIALAIIALIFSKKQKEIKPNNWSKAGKITGIIGIILNIILLVVAIIILVQNYDQLVQSGIFPS
jgi:hypothetical protein